MQNQVESMISYITSTNICRQSLLVRYFGEKNADPCGKCDVCIDHRKKGIGNQQKETSTIESKEQQQPQQSSKPRLSCREAILEFIGDSRVKVHDLKSNIPFSTEEISKTVSLMVASEELTIESIFIRKT